MLSNMSLKDYARIERCMNGVVAGTSDQTSSAVDMKAGGDLAQKLDALYEYMCLRLLMANLKNDPEPLDEVSSLLNELKGAWVEIDPEKAKALQISQSAPL